MTTSDLTNDGLDLTFCQAIIRGFGIVGRCRICEGVTEVTDMELAASFTGQLDQSLSTLRGRLTCCCGSSDLQLFTRYCRTIEWPLTSAERSNLTTLLDAREALLRSQALPVEVREALPHATS